MTVTSFSLRVALATGVLVAFAGCGGDENGAEHQAQSMPATSPGESAQQSIEPAAEEMAVDPESSARQLAEQLRQHVELPDYYPPDAPIYPGSQPSDAQELRGGRVAVVFSSPDAVDKVSEWLRHDLPSQGWTLTVEQAMDAGMMIQAIKPNRLVSVLLSRVESGGSEPTTIVAVAVDK